MAGTPLKHDDAKEHGFDDRVANFYLLGKLHWDEAVALQRRMVYEAGGELGQRLNILFCEHPPLITVGCAGSRRHVRMTDEQLRRQRVETRWISRGGGCVLHAPGQLCIYPIVPLAHLGWTVGEFMDRFRSGIQQALADLVVRAHTRTGSYHLEGRAGVLAALGIAVQNWVTYHGAFINVNPSMLLFPHIDTLDPERVQPGTRTTMTSLLAERRVAVTMAKVRSSMVAALADSFECSRHHIFSQHPLLLPNLEGPRETIARVG